MSSILNLTHANWEQQEVESSHTVVKTKGPSEGRFTFTSHEAGDHSLCLSTNYTSWFSNTHIRLYLDIVVGTTKADFEHDRGHISQLAAKVRDLNLKLEDIRREQQYQRERESDFRDLSESTNSRAVWYSLAQIAVILVTCVWQLRHLKVCRAFNCDIRFGLLTFLGGHRDSLRTGRCDSMYISMINQASICSLTRPLTSTTPSSHTDLPPSSQ
jgi:hypothetical protein